MARNGRSVCLAAVIVLLVVGFASGRTNGFSEATESAGLLQSLTEEEGAWLRDHPVIRVAMAPDWPPVEFVDERGEPSGISAEYLSLIERRLGITFERVRGLSWQEAYDRMRRWEIDMTTSVAETPERLEFWAFTRPYMQIPVVIATDRRVRYIDNMRELAGRKLAVSENYPQVEWISRDFPDIDLVKVSNPLKGLETVRRGEAFGYVDAMLTIGHYLTLPHMGSLVVSGQTPYVSAQSMAVRKDWALLAGILDKALDSIGEAERTEIYRRWVPVYVEYGYDRSRLWKIVAGVVFVILVLAAWVGKLVREIARRRQAETALRESRKLYHQIVETLPDAVCRWRPDTTLTFANNDYRSLFGISQDAPLGMKWLSYIPENKRDTIESFCRELAQTPRQVEYEHQIVASDGSIHWFQWIDSPIYDSKGALLEFQSIGRDITEHKRRELLHDIRLDILEILSEMGQVRECFEQIIEVVQERMEVDAVGLRLREGDDFPYLCHRGFTDDFLRTENSLLERDGEGGICRDADGRPNLEGLCGLVISGKTEPSNPLFTKAGSWWTNDAQALLDLPSAQDPRRDSRNRCIHEGFASVVLIPIRTHERIIGLLHLADRRKDRFTPDEIADLEVISANIGSALEHKRMAQELNDSLSLLRDAGRIAQFGGWWVDLEASRVNWSTVTAAIHGKPPEHSPSLAEYISLYAPEWQEHFTEIFNRCVREGVPFDEEMEIIAENGRRVWVRTTGEAVRDASGRIVRVHGALQDISGRRLLEAEFLQAQKMESIGRLAGGVAHDFNNLIMGVMGYTELAADKLPPEHPVQEDLDEILTGAKRTADLTRQLLIFARKQNVNPQKIDLNDPISNMLKMLGRLVGENLEMKWKPGANLWLVKMDIGQLDQVLVNLCVNARDAIAGVGRIVIETENARITDDHAVRNPESSPGDYVMLAVSDSGHGMTAEVREHIFEPFFTTRKAGKGTGLGLATVYGIVKQNNGFISVYSEHKQGTTFRIYLPRCFEERPTAELHDTADTETLRGTETILLVEDDRAVRDSTTRFLEQLGYTVLVAQSPGKALQMAAKHAGEIHLLLTDVVMPGLNGRELAGKLSETRPAMKVIYMSGYAAGIIAHQGIIDEDVVFLPKPFDRLTLGRKLRDVL